MAILEADGTITLCGRGSTSINTGGEKVFPEEVEQVLMSHPKVADTLVVGRADDRWVSGLWRSSSPRVPMLPHLMNCRPTPAPTLPGKNCPATSSSSTRSDAGPPERPTCYGRERACQRLAGMNRAFPVVVQTVRVLPPSMRNSVPVR